MFVCQSASSWLGNDLTIFKADAEKENRRNNWCCPHEFSRPVQWYYRQPHGKRTKPCVDHASERITENCSLPFASVSHEMGLSVRYWAKNQCTKKRETFLFRTVGLKPCNNRVRPTFKKQFFFFREAFLMDASFNDSDNKKSKLTAHAEQFGKKLTQIIHTHM